MKKFLAIFLAAMFILSMATMCVSAFSAPSKSDQKGYIDYFDFSNKDDRNRWAERYEEDVLDEDGEVIHKKGDLKYTSYNSEKDFVNSNGEKDSSGTFPTALLIERYSYDDNLAYSFKNDGEVAVFTANTTDTTGIAFKIANTGNTYAAGADADNRIEYVKMRIKNNSASSHFSIGAFRIFGGNSGFDSRTVATVDIDTNMSGWTTYTFSMRDLNYDQTGGYNWSAGIQEILLFPFGYGSANEGYEGAEIEIDYVVFGSLDYVTSYQSALEEKENSATEIKPLTLPTTTTYYTGDKLNFDGFSAEITFNGGEKEIITSASAAYNFEKPEDLGDNVKQWKTTVKLVYGSVDWSYEVTVVDVDSVEFATEQETDIYNKIDILKAGKFTPVGLTLKVNFADGTYKVKDQHEFTLDGTDFSAIDVPLSAEGYYEYIVTANYYGNTITFPVNLIDIKGIELTPIDETKDKVYYGTKIGADFFTVNCVYTDGSKKTLADSGLESNFSVNCDTAIQGGDATATAQIYNAAYGINVTEEVHVTVQTPTDLEVKLINSNKISVDSDIQLGWFTVSYKYADGTTAEISNTDPNLIINYDTSAPSAEGEKYTGKVKIGDMSATFNYSVLDAKFDADVEATKNELANRGTVKLLAPKFPTFWLVTIIVAAVVAVLVAAFCVLKFVFKVEFKFKKFDLDEIF